MRNLAAILNANRLCPLVPCGKCPKSAGKKCIFRHQETKETTASPANRKSGEALQHLIELEPKGEELETPSSASNGSQCGTSSAGVITSSSSDSESVVSSYVSFAPETEARRGDPGEGATNLVADYLAKLQLYLANC